MIVLLDRGLSGNDFLGLIAGTGAAFLARLSAARKPPVLRRFPDGSFLSQAGTLPVRIIECQITIATTAGRHTGVYRLATTLLDSRRPPAFELVKLYHERWEVESAYFALKKTMPGRRVLRSRTLPGIAQEIYALLALYQVIRIAIADATTAVPGTDPDRASFSVALPGRPRPGHPGRRGHRRHGRRPRRRHRAGSPEPAHARPPPARRSPSRQTPTVPPRLQEPASRPAHLQSNHQRRHLDSTARPVTSRPWALGPASPGGRSRAARPLRRTASLPSPRPAWRKWPGHAALERGRPGRVPAVAATASPDSPRTAIDTRPWPFDLCNGHVVAGPGGRASWQRTSTEVILLSWL